ncbi:MAG: ABC transporter ATP-binding protein [Thermoplasmata archaeon]
MKKIVVKNLTKIYEKRLTALDGISFSLDLTGIFSLIGRNGAGKTTLMRILSTELLPTSGEAYIDDVDVIKYPEAIRSRIAIIPQEARAVPWLTPRQTVVSYLLYRGFSRSEANRRSLEAIEKLQLNESMNKLNRMLSGGQKRKVLVACVVASEADILFLDEPSTGLDPLSRKELWDIINELKKERFIFLTTHYLEEAENLSSSIGILEGGRLVAIGTMDDLRKKFDKQFSIKIYDDSFSLNDDSVDLVKGYDGSTQIMVDQEKAYEITKILLERGIKFSTNPISLDDMYYYLVKKPIEAD